MKRTIAMFACLVSMAGLCAVACAGVVIDEQVTTTQGSSPAETHTRQLIVQGHKEKMISDRNVFVIDLDKGTMMLIDPNQKAYAEMPFPPHGMSSNPAQQLDLNFKKTGKSSKVLDYGCEEYSGAGKTAMASVATSGCFSTSAPGAAEFTAFTQAMGAKLKSANAMAGKMPGGIPLTMDSTRTVNAGFTMPGLTPDQAAKLKEAIAKRGPQSTRTMVTKIATRDLPADTFAAPAGYERRAMGGPGAPPPAGAAGGAGAPPPATTKVPE